MRNTIGFAASLVAVSFAFLFPTQAHAQCRRIVVRGPRVTVVSPCLAPPPVYVRVVPAPPPPPAVPAPPPVVVQPVAPCPAPPPPPVRVRRRHHFRLFTVGLLTEGTLFKDGGLGGGGVYAQIRLSRSLHLFGSVGANASCTTCHPNDPQRVDLKSTLGLQYYFLPFRRFSPYLRGSLVYQSVQFQDPKQENLDLGSINQLGVEVAAGLELRITRWLILGGDVAYLGLKRLDHEVDGPTPSGAPKGLATVNDFDHGATFRLNLAIRF